jgi:flagellar basal-body rod modification protein FlgD
MTTLNTGTSGASVGNNGSLTLTNNSKNGSSKGLSGVDFGTYITLLAKQLKNQDPMKPMDSSEFTSQIATYAQLEQQISANANLEKIAKSKDYSLQAVASSYLGKEVLADSNQIKYDGTKATDFGYNIQKAGAVSATVEIINSKGAVVRTMKVDTAQGPHSLRWDGKLDDGTTAAAGNYTVRSKAINIDGKVVGSNTLAYEKATELVTTNGETNIKLANGKVISFADITSVRMAL